MLVKAAANFVAPASRIWLVLRSSLRLHEPSVGSKGDNMQRSQPRTWKLNLTNMLVRCAWYTEHVLPKGAEVDADGLAAIPFAFSTTTNKCNIGYNRSYNNGSQQMNMMR